MSDQIKLTIEYTEGWQDRFCESLVKMSEKGETMDSVNEFVIEWIRGEKTASLTIPSNTRLKNKILKLAEKHKDADYIENKDGSIFAHIPVDWIKIYPPREVSEEEKEKLRELFNKNVKGNK